MKKLRILVALVALVAILIVVGHTVYRASIPVFVGGYSESSIQPSLKEGYEVQYLGEICKTEMTKKQWFHESDFTARHAIIAPDLPGLKIQTGRRASYDQAKLKFWARMYLIGQGDEDEEDLLQIVLEFDLQSRKVTLLNTGESLPISENEAFVVFVDDDFQAMRFVAMDPTKKLGDVHPEVSSAFTRILVNSDE